MLRRRIIPCLLLKDKGLVKTIRFKESTYVGDPINAVKVFNQKEVDELVFLDILATRERRDPPLAFLSRIASECFMPFAYGGGIRSIETVRELLAVGVEKVVINSYAFENPDFIRTAAERFGSQSIVVSIDVKKTMFGKYVVCTEGGTRNTKKDPAEYAQQMAALGAGEIFLTSMDRDGMQQGYDLDLIRHVAPRVPVPVIACGGAGQVRHFSEAIHDAGASAVAAGSMFVFTGPHRAVLINYPLMANEGP